MTRENLDSQLIRAYNEGYKQGREDAAEELSSCRNELCLHCGNYKQKHNGACDGCRWRDK